MNTNPWLIDETEQFEFAKMSGDFNPIHTDPLAARRTPFGRVAVHGLHLVLAALDLILVEHAGTPRRVSASFQRPVGIGDEISVHISPSHERVVRAEIQVESRVAVKVSVELGATFEQRTESIPKPERSDPADLDLIDVSGLSGSLAALVDADHLSMRFPNLVERLGVVAAAELVTLTRLVGMHVPGLNSLLSSFGIRIGATGRPGQPVVDYAVTDIDDRFSSITMTVTGSSIQGNVKSFVRARPTGTDSHDLPDPTDEFANTRFLVIGGSRGLGALAVILLARGGSDVRFTYRTGQADAASTSTRAPASMFYKFDTNTVAADLKPILADGWNPTHVAYFATPPIFAGGRGSYSQPLYEQFRDIYVDGFRDLIDHLGPDALRGVLWPSSEAVAAPVPGLVEYGKAKMLGEEYCSKLQIAHPNLDICTPRWPLLLTDQTTSFVPTTYGDSVAEVTAALRAVTR